MKLLKETLLTSFAVLLAMTATTTNADTNPVFPPANALDEISTNNYAKNGYVYPPQAPSQPILNRMPKAPSHNYNRSYPQQPHYPTNTNNRLTPPAYGQYPPQAMPRAMPRTMPRTMPRAMPRSMPNQAYQKQYPRYPYTRQNTNNGFPFSNNLMPFGNSRNNNFFPFSNGNFPFNNNGNSFGMPSNPMNNMFGNNRGNMPFFNKSKKKRKKAWGDKRNIWPDFYTDFTDEAWDTAMGGPRDLGVMPGGWRFPYISTPDPVTVSDAIVNQFPPIAEEAGNMADFSDWGVFNKK